MSTAVKRQKECVPVVTIHHGTSLAETLYEHYRECEHPSVQVLQSNAALRGRYLNYHRACDRCRNSRPDHGLVMSAYNLDKICEKCKVGEMRRSDYAEAEGANAIATRNSMKDWYGIGFSYIAGEEIQ